MSAPTHDIRPAPSSATLPPGAARLLRDPEAVAAIERLRFLGYTPTQVGRAMDATAGEIDCWHEQQIDRLDRAGTGGS